MFLNVLIFWDFCLIFYTFPTMHCRLVLKDRNFCLGEPAFLSQNPKKFTTQKIIDKVSFFCCCNFSDMLFDKKPSVHAVPGPGRWHRTTEPHTDIATESAQAGADSVKSFRPEVVGRERPQGNIQKRNTTYTILFITVCISPRLFYARVLKLFIWIFFIHFGECLNKHFCSLGQKTMNTAIPQYDKNIQEYMLWHLHMLEFKKVGEIQDWVDAKSH